VLLALRGIAVALLTACSSGNNHATNTAGSPAAGPSTSAVAATAPAVAASAAVTFPQSITGSDGTSLTLSRAPERIISLSPGATEVLFAIGAGKAVVADDRFSDYPDAAKALPKVEYSRPSAESLVAFKPDLVITAGRQRDTVAALRAADLPVVLFDEPTSVQGVLAQIRTFGRFTGHAAEAEPLAAAMEGRIRAVTGKLSGVTQGPRIYHEISSQFFSATPASFVGDLYTLLKAQNIAEGSSPYPQLSAEVIVQRDPEVVVLADGREGMTVDQARARAGWSAISAVRNNRIILLTDTQADITSRPGPRLVDGLEQLAKMLYPDIFA
jgi:iron complex transport system substrate-binding protein